VALTIRSPAFHHLGPIPTKYTCEGENVSPALDWTDVPAGTRSFVLIVDDPDAPDPAAPQRTWVHWVVYNIPASATGLPAHASALPPSTECGFNDWNHAAWAGPCPPVGRHHYFFKLYALDTVFPYLPNATKVDIEAAMSGHILEQGELIGTYEKGKPRSGKTSHHREQPVGA
jgi:Raf kinase inhibitor-like YbhB/YbcL family protein